MDFSTWRSLLTGRALESMEVITLSPGSLDDENTITEPAQVVPVESTAKAEGADFDYECTPYSLIPQRIPAEQLTGGPALFIAP